MISQLQGDDFVSGDLHPRLGDVMGSCTLQLLLSLLSSLKGCRQRRKGTRSQKQSLCVAGKMKIRDYSHVGIQIRRRKSTTELVVGDGSQQVVSASVAFPAGGFLPGLWYVTPILLSLSDWMIALDRRLEILQPLSPTWMHQNLTSLQELLCNHIQAMKDGSGDCIPS